MGDLSMEEIRGQLEAAGLRPVDDEDLAEITHRVNAVHEAVLALEHPDVDAVEPVTVFWLDAEGAV